MKRFFAILIMLIASTVLVAQTPINYKEGDFTGKQLKSKSLKLDNNWLIDKGTTGTVSWKYNNTAVSTMTSAGVLGVTGLTNSGTLTNTGAATFTGEIKATGGVDGVYTTTVSLDSAKIETLYSAPSTLVAAVTGKYIQLISATLLYTDAAGVYTRGGGIYIGINTTGSTVVAQSDTIGCAIPRANASSTYMFPVLSPAGGIALTVSKPLVVAAALRDFVGGTNVAGSAKINLTYRVVTP